MLQPNLFRIGEKEISYTPSKEILKMSKMISKNDITRGAFEVYFMNVKLFSKILSNTWPNYSLVAQKCVKAYDDIVSGGDPF